MNINKKRLLLIIPAIGILIAGILVGAKKSDFPIGSNAEVLVNLFRDINIFYVDPVDPDDLMKDAAIGMTMNLDPYTEFMPAEDMEQFEVLTTGKYGGIGSLISQKDEWVYIKQPYAGFPADKAGLKPGDRILSIDGTDAKGIGSARVSALMKGDPGTSFEMVVGKFPDYTPVTLTITRERIVLSGIPYYGFVSEGIGYILHDDFTEDCASDLLNAFMEMRNTGELKGLIIDYRGNGGGILQQAVKILSYFVPKGTEVVSMRGKLRETNAEFRTESEPFDLDIPIAVLVSSGSASAAEIVSGALQDLDRAVLIGQRTFGKGLVQSTRPVGYNSYLKITTAKYYIPSGRCIQAIDYAHRNDDGSVSYVPDSLINEFRTLNGRRVYDGGGVMPDIRMPGEIYTPFTFMAYARGYLEDFEEEYARRHGPVTDPDNFILSDSDYEEFINFMLGKPIPYESETKRAVELLKKSAEKELYFDSISEEIARLEEKVSNDIRKELLLNREQISKIITDNILLRDHYREGVTLYNLPRDGEITAAIELLNDPDRYREILFGKDTDRK